MEEYSTRAEEAAWLARRRLLLANSRRLYLVAAAWLFLAVLAGEDSAKPFFRAIFGGRMIWEASSGVQI